MTTNGKESLIRILIETQSQEVFYTNLYSHLSEEINIFKQTSQIYQNQYKNVFWGVSVVFRTKEISSIEAG